MSPPSGPHPHVPCEIYHLSQLGKITGHILSPFCMLCSLFGYSHSFNNYTCLVMDNVITGTKKQPKSPRKILQNQRKISWTSTAKRLARFQKNCGITGFQLCLSGFMFFFSLSVYFISVPLCGLSFAGYLSVVCQNCFNMQYCSQTKARGNPC